MPDDPAYTEDYPVDWPDAPLPTPSDDDLAVSTTGTWTYQVYFPTPSDDDPAASEAQADAADRMWARVMVAWLFFGFCLLAAIITSAAR
jgi:hypothetical protein